jgi:diaminohydroxyphosphoribosylaminopyrimidine deaminase / 5-amino-6-(5-phosphoribosylamino)uracil reductase
MKNSQLDMHYMKMALDLAKKGRGFVNPNPMVGAVIVKEGKVLGKGYHKFFGGPHAEVYALKEAGENAKDSCLYVTLEPCSHYGKTPPCAKAIIKSGIKRVVIASVDPNPLVSGNGIKMLKAAGIEVDTGVMESSALQLNEVFMKYISKRLPFVVMKCAVTLDGKIATCTGESKWITGKASRNRVHKMRNSLTAVMVGVGTILDDNPLLTTRLEGKSRSPKAIILDSKLKSPVNSRVFETLKEREVIIACTEKFDEENYAKLKDKGVKIIICPEDSNSMVDLKYLVRKLGKLGIDSILIEGGGSVNFSALKSDIVDKVVYFIAPKIFGGKDAKTSVEGSGIESISDEIKLENVSVKSIGEDIMIEAYLPKRLIY